jgi:hypothetical protein
MARLVRSEVVAAAGLKVEMGTAGIITRMLLTL